MLEYIYALRDSKQTYVSLTCILQLSQLQNQAPSTDDLLANVDKDLLVRLVIHP
jgi:hypothetical protein